MRSLTPIRQSKISAPTRPAIPELLSLRTFWIAALLAFATVLGLYLPSLDFQFILDDHRFTNDPRIQSSGHIWEYFTTFVWAQFTGGPPSFYRPAFLLWMRLNFLLCELSPSGWHLLSIFKHLAVAALLGMLVWKLLRDRGASLLAATLFALHPAQTESVAWVTVPDPLMSIGILLAVLLYFRYVDGTSAVPKKSRQPARIKVTSRSPFLWWIASALICFLSLLAKETAIVLPLTIFVLALLTEPSPLVGQAKIDSRRDLIIRFRALNAIRLFAPFAFATVVYLLLRLNALGGKLNPQTQHLPLSTVFFSWPATASFYLKVLFWPVRSHAFADPTLVDRFTLRGVLLPGMGVICLAAVALAWINLLWKKSRILLAGSVAIGARRALTLGAILLTVPLLLALDVNALNPGDFLHGRYTYLPLAGIALLVSTAWLFAGKFRLSLLLFAVALAVAFATLTYMQESQWKDDLSVFTTAHDLAPNNAPVARNLANAHVQQALQLDEQGRCGEAIPVFEQVIHEFPDDWYAWAALGDCRVQTNDLTKAEEALRRAADLSHDPQVIGQWQQLRANMGLPHSPSAQ